jgi:hypothetical protein
MPRRARTDVPGALQHVICRGIERRKIFWQDSDRDDFRKRLEAILGETQTPCYAWALMPNHFRSFGMTAVALSKMLGISQPAVTRAAYRGEAIAAANSLNLVEIHDA